MPVLTVVQGNKTELVKTESGLTVLKVLQQAGLTDHVQAPCGGKSSCGACRAVLNGKVSEITPEEKRLLGDDRQNRLICIATVQGDCTVVLAEKKKETVTESICNVLETDGEDGFGIAVDIGTTTIAMYLYNLATGEKLAHVGQGNKQAAFGADVISRIQYCISNTEGASELSKVLHSQINQMIIALCEKTGISLQKIIRMVIVGNTVMEHFMTNIPPLEMSRAPFIPTTLFGYSVKTQDCGLNISPEAQVFVSPCISGFVGGDISAGLLAVKSLLSKDKMLFVDIGTNGEMAIGDKNGLICCSTAAGPAFEGASISCGMFASDGAIDKFWIEESVIKYEVIGNKHPLGICGSGLVDALAVMLEVGVVDETGRLLPADEVPEEYSDKITGEGSKTRFEIAPDIWITAEDVRKLQLAKSAIAAGIQTLLDVTETDIEEISNFYIAGGFGNYIHSESAVKIGLFPKELLSKLKVVGNSAGAGASMALLTQNARLLMQETADKCDYIELSGLPQFNEAYMDCMMFE